MERIVLSPLPVTLETEKLMEQNHSPADSDMAQEFSDLVEAARRVLCCKTILVKAEGSVDFPLPPGAEPKYYYAMTVGREIDEDEDCDGDCENCSGCDDTDYYEIVCPSCGETVCFDESLDPENLTCPACGEKFGCIVDESDFKKIDKDEK